MPRRLRPRCRHIFTLVAVLFVVPASVEAQSSVVLNATVSETVALSVAPTSTPSNVNVVSSGGNTVRITLSGDDAQAQVIRVPLLVRSNSSFKIVATVESRAAGLTQLSVAGLRATGRFVSPLAISEFTAPGQFDVAAPFTVASGPRVSLLGTLASPNNALEITLLIGVNPEPTSAWKIHLTLVATAAPPIQ